MAKYKLQHVRLLFIDKKVGEGLKSWILSWGKDAQVVSPKKFAEEIKREIGAVVSFYSNC